MEPDDNLEGKKIVSYWSKKSSGENLDRGKQSVDHLNGDYLMNEIH